MSNLPQPAFSSSAEYLAYIRAAYAQDHRESAPDVEMSRLTRLDLERNDLPLPDPEDPYSHVIRDLERGVQRTFEDRYKTDIGAMCAIGALRHPSVNACCFRSPEGHYAIVIHNGLMNLLHKHSKLLTAAADPKAVTYCNRTPVFQLSRHLLLAWANELGDIYREFGETKGAIVKLDQSATRAATTMLTLAEAFVLGHEVGHLLAGHLEHGSRLVVDSRLPWLQLYAENSSHQDEFTADDYGFVAMRGHLDPTPPYPVLLGGLLSTFEALRLIGAGAANQSHPGVSDRIQNVVDKHFSERTCQLIRSWTSDGDEEAAFEALETAAAPELS